MCSVLFGLVRLLYRRCFCCFGSRQQKRSDAGIAFFPIYHTWAISVYAAWKWWIVSGLSFPSWNFSKLQLCCSSLAPGGPDPKLGLDIRMAVLLLCSDWPESSVDLWANGSPCGWDHLVLSETANVQTKSMCSVFLHISKAFTVPEACLMTVWHVCVWLCV